MDMHILKIVFTHVFCAEVPCLVKQLEVKRACMHGRIAEIQDVPKEFVMSLPDMHKREQL